MILPIYTYGAAILRQETNRVERDSPELQKLIDDMIQTMQGADGIGLAAPQVGRGERLFVVDVTLIAEDLRNEGATVPEQPMVFINPEIVALSEEEKEFEEGCLSIPDIRENVVRPTTVRIRYTDRLMQPREVELEGMLARVVQHELDHLNGILFIDRITPFKRRLLRRRLKEMADGKVEAEYPLAETRVES